MDPTIGVHRFYDSKNINPGLPCWGHMTVDAVFQRDATLLPGVVSVSSLAVVIVTFIIDLLNMVLDPWSPPRTDSFARDLVAASSKLRARVSAPAAKRPRRRLRNPLGDPAQTAYTPRGERGPSANP